MKRYLLIAGLTLLAYLVYLGPAALMGAGIFVGLYWYFRYGGGKIYYTAEDHKRIREERELKVRQRYEAMGGAEGEAQREREKEYADYLEERAKNEEYERQMAYWKEEQDRHYRDRN